MDGFGVSTLTSILKDVGPLGVVLIMWWHDTRQMREILSSYREDVNEVRQMYENNVELVKDYRNLATDLKEVVMMNTQAMTTIAGDVEKNQFCPLVRKEQA